MAKMTAAQSESFAKNFLKAEAKSSPLFGGLFSKRRDLVESLAAKMFQAAEAGAPLNSKAARKAFVKDFLDREAKAVGGGVWLELLFSVLLPILLKLLESFRQKEAA